MLTSMILNGYLHTFPATLALKALLLLSAGRPPLAVSTAAWTGPWGVRSPRDNLHSRLGGSPAAIYQVGWLVGWLDDVGWLAGWIVGRLISSLDGEGEWFEWPILMYLFPNDSDRNNKFAEEANYCVRSLDLFANTCTCKSWDVMTQHFKKTQPRPQPQSEQSETLIMETRLWEWLVPIAWEGGLSHCFLGPIFEVDN